jgi:hypothetical protein
MKSNIEDKNQIEVLQALSIDAERCSLVLKRKKSAMNSDLYRIKKDLTARELEISQKHNIIT